MLSYVIKNDNIKVELFANRVVKTIAHTVGGIEYRNHIGAELLWAHTCSELPNHLQYKILVHDEEHVVIEMKLHKRIPLFIYQEERLKRILSDILDQIIGLNTVTIYHNDINMSNIVMDGDKYLLIDYGSCRPRRIARRSAMLFRLFLEAQPERFPSVDMQNIYKYEGPMPSCIDCSLGALLWENRSTTPEAFRDIFDEYLQSTSQVVA